MIMDGRKELKTEGCSDKTELITPVKVVKRPFDVAFLMLPDEKLKQKKTEKACFGSAPEPYNSPEEDEEIEVGTNQDFLRAIAPKHKVFSESKPVDELRKSPPVQKSAFTKVNLRLSPNLSISPDLTYQNSLSPSPPILPRNYPSPPNLISSAQIFKNQQINAYQTTFLQENFPQVSPDFGKIRPMYRPELPYNYQQISTPEIRSPAAAILTSLLPPSLAALSLPAQNVCAKCNISFRMTSDLVYHMRSHHKNDSVDVHRKRREDKLKCPVCAESFRERHHLTRHMTAHQDKEDEDGNVKKKSV